MPDTPYTRHNPEPVDDTITRLVANGRLRKVVPPVLFFARGKLMLVGQVGERRLKLVSEPCSVGGAFSRRLLQEEVQDQADFAFTKDSPIKPVEYLGLVRHKHADRSFIAPVVVRLDEPPEAPELQPSPEWVKHELGNPDRVWVDAEGMLEILAKGMVTANTAAIIRFAFNQI